MQEKFPMLGSAPAAPPSMDELRERAATALERALAFVKSAGHELAVLRAHVALQAQTTAEAIEILQARQRPDGAFDRIGHVFDGPTEARLVATSQPDEILGSLEALSVLADWKLLYTPCAERIVDFLRATQQPDGGWGAGEPDSSERIFMTAMLAGFSGSTRCARPEMIVPARDYIASHWSVDRLRREGWLLCAAYAHYYSTVTDEDREIALPWCGRELERGYRDGEVSARATMRVLIYCDASTLPGTQFDVLDLLAKLIDEAGEDGGFGGTEANPGGRVGPTLDAMIAILRLCRANI